MSDVIPDEELIGQLRKAASTWFKNSDLLLLEELIRRYSHLRSTLQTVHVHLEHMRNLRKRESET